MNQNSGTLYIVSTPIGNLEDITLRALRILKEVDIVLAEDTRKTGFLLKHYSISKRLLSYHKYNEKARVDKIISLLEEGKNLALVSDAGTPGISDPSNIIVKEIIEKNFPLTIIPGVSAFIPALVGSGFSTDSFYFCGFLSKKMKKREDSLIALSKIKDLLVFYESPHRISDLLLSLSNVLGNRKVAFAREITKKFETFYRGNIDDFLNQKIEIKLKGEFVVIVEGFTEKSLDDEFIKGKIVELIESKMSKKKAVTQISRKYNLPKNRVYKLSLKLLTKK